MELRIRIKTDNAAFQEGGSEVARILRDFCDRRLYMDAFAAVGDEGSLHDINGNTVGKWEVK